MPEELWTTLALGHAPDAWDSIGKALTPAFPEDLLIEAGLLQPRAEGKGAYDRFRDRLLFVVRDERGRPVGFGGRALSPEGEPKYLNSPESPIFSKKRLLYGLFSAREAIRRRDRVVLVEGYFDHLALVRAGVDETVASMGTALTPEQAEKLRRLTSNAVVCYDGDSAGRNATRGALQLLLAQGFQARVARLPDGRRPGRPARQREGPEALGAPHRGGAGLPDLAPRGPAAGGERTSRRPRSGSGSAGSSRSSTPSPTGSSGTRSTASVAEAVSIPLEVLWSADKANLKPPITRSIDVGTSGNSTTLSAMAAPVVERKILRALAAGELNSLILRTLKDEYLSDPRVKRVVSAFRKSADASEPVDFQRQIADLTEDERTFLSGVALDESPEPTEKDVDRLLKALEIKHLEAESATLLTLHPAGGGGGPPECGARLSFFETNRIETGGSRG